MSTNRDHLLLDLWKPPSGSGGAIGCLASTFNFSPTLFEEECLARFLEVDAAPNHEELAFLIEREHRLGEVYAGVLVDYSHAGVGHSFRWDIMPVRVHKAIQHSKVSLLVWANHVRIIIASTNLTEAGYRTNREVAVSLDLQPQASDRTMLTSVLTFLRRVVSHSLGFRMNDDKDQLPSIQRALSFLSNVEHRAEGWVDKPPNHRVRQFFVSTFPESSDLEPASSSLDQAIDHCRKRGNSPHIIWIASPFYDDHFDTVSSICRSMARGSDRSLVFCVPCSHDDEADMALINAPKLLADTPPRYKCITHFNMLPRKDKEGNLRLWHAKMMEFIEENYVAVMIGSANCTSAGLGSAKTNNIEANLLTIVDYVKYGREIGQLEEFWPDMDPVPDIEAAQWLGSASDAEDSPDQGGKPWPIGFQAAVFKGGEKPNIIVHFLSDKLPSWWVIRAFNAHGPALVDSTEYGKLGAPAFTETLWRNTTPPDKLFVAWDEDHSAFLPLNIEDESLLPAPVDIQSLSTEELLSILATTNPGARYRLLAKRLGDANEYDSELSAYAEELLDLNPLNRYSLRNTFLHRVRYRARTLTQIRANLEKPVYSAEALQWRLRGVLGIGLLAERMMEDFTNHTEPVEDAILYLSDFVILFSELDYHPEDSSLPREEYYEVYYPVLQNLIGKMDNTIQIRYEQIPSELMQFWKRVVAQCKV